MQKGTAFQNKRTENKHPAQICYNLEDKWNLLHLFSTCHATPSLAISLPESPSVSAAICLHFLLKSKSAILMRLKKGGIGILKFVIFSKFNFKKRNFHINRIVQ